MNIQNTQITADRAGQAQSARPDKEAKLEKACRDFEAIMIKQLLTSMRKSIPRDGLFGNDSFARETFQEMSDDQLARQMAQGRGMGIAEAMYEQLSNKLHLSAKDLL